ncbi:hypothetical protein PXK01_19475 [Phaeobacter sp. PT47_59]|uniref:hypothetical protein n=1 Tax=Phaeobacter sp. PT47_59 TaxID=3029979 RepID=UPI00237FDDDB|nr:hypothetical protein [Phaeobacter sp. PT47_59]MDE4176342.1 hypothetical protein [Phaeobacter sp. PT47_59]
MSDAPERIWAQDAEPSECDYTGGGWWDDECGHTQYPHMVEYVRADTITALQAENERLREALEAAKVRLEQTREIAGLGFPSTMCAIDAALNHTEKEEG